MAPQCSSRATVARAAPHDGELGMRLLTLVVAVLCICSPSVADSGVASTEELTKKVLDLKAVIRRQTVTIDALRNGSGHGPPAQQRRTPEGARGGGSAHGWRPRAHARQQQRDCEPFQVPLPGQLDALASHCRPSGLRNVTTWLRGLAAGSPLGEDQLDRGIVSRGKSARWAALMRKVAARGRGVRVAVAGGSITHELEPASATEAEVQRDRDLGGWGLRNFGRQFFEWLNATFPHPDNAYRNGAVPGTTSAFMEMCLEARVGPDADLVVLEYAVNDLQGLDAMERLLRRALALPSAPAVVVLNLPSFARWGPAFHIPVNRTDFTFFPAGWEASEFKYASFAQYYTLPLLSLYKAIYVEVHRHQEGYLLAGRREEELEERFVYQANFRHPNPRGQRMAAHLLVRLVQEGVVAHVMQSRGGAAASELEEGPAVPPLPPPLLPGNYGGHGYTCSYGAATQSLVTASEGWALSDDGATAGKRKLGMASFNIGDTITFQVVERMEADFRVVVGFLMSWDARMGLAAVRCGGSCRCACVLDGDLGPANARFCRPQPHDRGDTSAAALVDTAWEDHSTQTQPVQFEALREGEADGPCLLTIQNVKKQVAGTGQISEDKDFKDKLKVTSIMSTRAAYELPQLMGHQLDTVLHEQRDAI